MALAPAGTVDILHVPYTYFPDSVGGTEVYVAGLSRALQCLGSRSAIAAPSSRNAAYDREGIPVFRFAIDQTPGLAAAYGEPDSVATGSFASLISQLRPRIVHLHARTAAVSERLVDAARAIGAKTVFTYHTPAVSCVRGTMMRLGNARCDGVLNHRRCTSCVLAAHNVPPLLGNALARVPTSVGHALASTGLSGRVVTALRMPALVDAAHRRFHDLMAKVDRVIAVCEWVRAVLLANGVPEDKVALCRQGLPLPPSVPEVCETGNISGARPAGPLRLGYFGRLHPAKGLDILIDALRLVPQVAVELAIYGIGQPGSERYAAALRSRAQGDPRVSFRPVLASASVQDAMRHCDLVAVPSRWMETGPLVVLEAFAARTPVLGTRLGGIKELVRDEVDGVLLSADDPRIWACALAALAAAPGRVARLRSNIRPPRTMSDVADEMAIHYRDLISDAGD